MVLPALILGLAAAFFWAGFRARPHALQHLSRAAFFVFVGLALFAGYFAWREHRGVAELARLIEPVPQVTDVVYVPTAAEIEAVADAMAMIPGDRGGLGSTQEERRRLAGEARDLRRRYWKLETALEPERIAEFYREADHRNGWELTLDDPPWLGLERGSETLTLFVHEEWKTGRVAVWYLHDNGGGPGAGNP